MKIISLSLLLLIITIKISANENWIDIKAVSKTQTSKSNTHLKPINKMINRVTLIKKLIDSKGKKDELNSNKKNWFLLKTKDSK
jgi:hypothetical protein